MVFRIPKLLPNFWLDLSRMKEHPKKDLRVEEQPHA
jgi:hypothetical protein